MSVQAIMSIHDKRSASAASVASGEALYPASSEVSIVSMPAVADEHRLADIQRAVEICIDFARDTNQFGSSGSTSIVTSLNGGKAAIRVELIATNVVTGDIGIMITGSVRNKGSRNITEEAHKQLLDWMNENGRLAT